MNLVSYLSGQCGQGCVKSIGKTDLGLLEIKLQPFTPRRNSISLELYSKQPILLVIYKCFVYALSQSENYKAPNLKSADRPTLQKTTA